MPRADAMSSTMPWEMLSLLLDDQSGRRWWAGGRSATPCRVACWRGWFDELSKGVGPLRTQLLERLMQGGALTPSGQ